jgi:hypothetical protein
VLHLHSTAYLSEPSALCYQAVMPVPFRPPPALQFLSRPFVAGDVVQFNGPGSMTVAGVVDKVAPMRVMLRTEDGAVVSIPNKVGRAGVDALREGRRRKGIRGGSSRCVRMTPQSNMSSKVGKKGYVRAQGPVWMCLAPGAVLC